jgi:2-methylisocitrate lyase-like PEP mutase family enzyme
VLAQGHSITPRRDNLVTVDRAVDPGRRHLHHHWYPATVPTQSASAAHFLSLHTAGRPLLMPNAWDVGSAVLLASLGFDALASTSGGFAASQGRLDGAMTRDEVLAHVAELAAATEVSLSADLENCFADDPQGVADTITRAVAAGVAGCSVEDYRGDHDDPIYGLGLATERVAAAAEAAHDGAARIVLTARAENYLHGRKDLADTIARLQAYQEAGADVLFAPRVHDPDELRQVIQSVDVPVSVLALPGAPTVPELAALGVSRISVGGAFAVAAYGAIVNAAKELREQGTYGYWDLTAVGGQALAQALSR